MGVIVAIDGPAGAGKSTTAREVARRLGYIYVDTGAMYRAITLQIIRNEVDLQDMPAVEAVVSKSHIEFCWQGEKHCTWLNGKDVSKAIRSVEVAQLVSPVSAIEGVRRIMANQQRQMAKSNNIVMEGRDIGTNVFPDADFKFFLIADLKVRARRRIKDYRRLGQDLKIEEIKAELVRRDQIDSSRAYAPLKQASDAIVIDTSRMEFEEQVETIVRYVTTRK
jgi:cytidylate kinase